MKSIILSLFLSTAAFANSECPNLAGQFYCLVQDGPREPKLDILTMKQWTESSEPGVTYYSSDYRSAPGEMVMKADADGIADEWGWISKCKNNRLMSVTRDFSAMSEMYIEKNEIVRAYNQVVVQRCSRKN